jgi:hypothetical protein
MKAVKFTMKAQLIAKMFLMIRRRSDGSKLIPGVFANRPSLAIVRSMCDRQAISEGTQCHGPARRCLEILAKAGNESWKNELVNGKMRRRVLAAERHFGWILFSSMDDCARDGSLDTFTSLMYFPSMYISNRSA